MGPHWARRTDSGTHSSRKPCLWHIARLLRILRCLGHKPARPGRSVQSRTCTRTRGGGCGLGTSCCLCMWRRGAHRDRGTAQRACGTRGVRGTGFASGKTGLGPRAGAGWRDTGGQADISRRESRCSTGDTNSGRDGARRGRWLPRRTRRAACKDPGTPSLCKPSLSCSQSRFRIRYLAAYRERGKDRKKEKAYLRTVKGNFLTKYCMLFAFVDSPTIACEENEGIRKNVQAEIFT